MYQKIDFEGAVLETINGRTHEVNGRLPMRPLPGDNHFFPLVDAKQEILTLARINHWDNVIQMGEGDMVNEPTVINNWKVYPASQYTGVIPLEGMDRVYTLLNAGVSIKGVMVLDDVRHIKLIDPPDPILPRLRPRPPKVDWGFVLLTTLKILGGMVAAVAALVVGSILVAALVVVGAVGLVLAGVGAAVMYDPALVVVTEDDQWVAVYMWLER